ncbi:hypothetical protein [Mycolicibacterium pulveris]|uniref:hypothetical protein n=1 Tax=Mycolicibacterium pulveris TaxID=36813 RepID=UPI001F17AB37|nr:hypothetical protein [Mycolicibacterium pulveris]
MAAPELRVVRRRKGALTASVAPPGKALVAASAPVEKADDVFRAAGLAGRRENWQDEAWEHYDRVGEFSFYVRWRARTCSRVRLVASEIDPDTGIPTGSVDPESKDGQRFAEMVHSIAGGPLGQAALIERLTEVLCVPGEVWIALLQRPEGQRWFAVTREEIEQSTKRNSVKITLPDGKTHDFDKDAGDGMFRVWNPHARRASEPDSPARGVLDALREIVRSTKRISNADLSRLISAGILAIPSEASLPSAAAPVSADKPEGSPEPPESESAAEQLQQKIIRVASTAAEEGEKSLASLVPLVINGPGEWLDKIQHITFGDEVTKDALETRDKAVTRLARGLDMSPEQLLGLGSTSNHWNSFLLKDEDVQVFVAPMMKTICQAIYERVLRDMATKAGIDATKYTLWFDASAITADPDLSDEAREGHDRGAVTSAALRRLNSLPEDSGYDLTTIEGWQELARDKIAKADPAVAAELLREWRPLLDPVIQSIQFPEPLPRLPAGRSGDSGGGVVDGDADEEPDTERSADEDRPRPVVAAGSQVDLEELVVEFFRARALELAGKRRRTRADMDRLRHVPAHQTHRYMGPVAEGDVGRLIKDWDTILDDDELAACGVDPQRVRAEVKRRAVRELTAPLLDGQVV